MYDLARTLRGQLEQAEARNTLLAAEVERLKVAIDPFADEAERFDCMRSGNPDAPDSTEITVKLGLLRAAARARRATGA